MHKLRTSVKDSDDLSTGFDRSRDRREELTNSKNIKGKYHLRVMFKDFFGFAEHQEKATYEVGYKLTLTKNKDHAVLQQAVALADARFKSDHFH